MIKRLNIFVDETGEFGYGVKSSMLYGISFTFHEQDNDISGELNNLNNRLMKYDDYVIDSSYSNWREIIAVYSVKYNNSENNSIVFYINEDNISRLKNVF